MFICLCKGVSDQELIEKAQERSQQSIDQTCKQLGVGTCCGICLRDAKEIIRMAKQASANKKKKP